MKNANRPVSLPSQSIPEDTTDHRCEVNQSNDDPLNIKNNGFFYKLKLLCILVSSGGIVIQG